MPEPTKTPSTPSCIIRAASAGVAIPPAAKLTTGRRPSVARLDHQLVGRPDLLAVGHEFIVGQSLQTADLAQHGPGVAHGLDHVAGAGLALGADHGRAFADAPQRLAQVAAAAHERHLEGMLLDVVVFVGGGQHFRLVDVVDAEGFQDLGLDEVADAAFGHDGDRHGLHDLQDEFGVAHARHAAVGADIGRNAFERHHRHSAGVLGDARRARP